MNRKRVWLRRGMYGVGILAVLTLMVWVGAYVFMSHLVKSWLTPEQYTEMQRFLNAPLAIPPECQDVAPYPDVLIQSASEVSAMWAQEKRQIVDQIGSASTYAFLPKMRTKAPVTEEEWQRITSLVDAQVSYRDRFARCVTMPEYEMGVFDSSSEMPIPDFLMLQTTTKLFCLRAYTAGRVGNWGEAFAGALMGVHVAKVHPCGTLILKLIATACTSISAQCVANLAKDCTDSEALRSAEEVMNHVRAASGQEVPLERREQDIFGSLRWYKMRGFPLDFSRARTGREWIRLYLGLLYLCSDEQTPPATEQQLQQAVARRLSPPERLSAALNRLWLAFHMRRIGPFRDFSMEIQASEGVYLIAGALGFRQLADEAFYIYSQMHEVHDADVAVQMDAKLSGWHGFENRQQTSQAHLDLARLALAVKMEQLAGKNVTGLAQVAPYFPEEPRDPFAAGPYLWDASEQVFYSAGPDRKDDGDRLEYDPTNGVLSAGDISLR